MKGLFPVQRLPQMPRQTKQTGRSTFSGTLYSPMNPFVEPPDAVASDFLQGVFFADVLIDLIGTDLD